MLRRAGFTLVELMIVVAIIGILATIAIPNYLKMSAKAKQAEAKMNLGSIFVVQIAYYSENSTYAGGSAAFTNLGWEPGTVHVTRYAYMMDSALITPLHNPPASLPAVISVTNKSFTAIAAGNIDNDLFIDVWTINDAKIMINRESDLSY